MPETRIVSTTYDINGNIIDQVTEVISDEQLAKEALIRETNETHTAVVAALSHWNQVTDAQKDQLLKFLCKFYLVAGEKLNLWPIGLE